MSLMRNWLICYGKQGYIIGSEWCHLLRGVNSNQWNGFSAGKGMFGQWLNHVWVCSFIALLQKLRYYRALISPSGRVSFKLRKLLTRCFFRPRPLCSDFSLMKLIDNCIYTGVFISSSGQCRSLKGLFFIIFRAENC